MRMFIEAFRNGEIRPEACRRAALEAVRFLEQVSRDLPSLRKPAVEAAEPRPGSLGHIMWQAARLVGDSDLTPLVAVAGTIADATADYLEDQGMTRIVVNNGGDLAIRLKGQERIYVGIRPDVRKATVSHRVLLTADMRIGGIATSGIGGRSLTRGIASAATVFSRDAARADAAATALANATYVFDPAVIRVPAESLFPDTDLIGMNVTASVGDLSDPTIEQALDQAVLRAEQLVGLDVVWGACIFVKERMISTAGISRHVEAIESS